MTPVEPDEGRAGRRAAPIGEVVNAFNAKVSEWWNTPGDYEWLIREVRVQRFHRTLLSTASLAYGTSGVLTAWWFSQGHGRPGAAPVALIIGLSSILIAIAWLRGPFPSQRMSLAIIAYADITTVLVVAMYKTYFDALPGLALLAANGIYLVIHHRPWVMVVHFVFSVIAMSFFVTMAAIQGPAPVGLVVNRMFALSPVVLGIPLMLMPLVIALRRDALRAFRDPLTGMNNRRGLFADVEQLPDGDREVTALVIDIDKFKSINDRFGHAVGDAVLMAVAEIIDHVVPDGAITARTGGEEFAVVIPAGVRADNAGPGERFCCDTLAARLRRSIAWVDDRVTVTISIGLSAATTIESARDLDDLLVAADLAMYRAKTLGGNQVSR
ncbi:diguanylate cyclase [Williamsia sp. CHRR-6]|uniref:GGDEF domain-containing protein n=1 Tax=Williamsia sp. CHRR-6 TaxID=2835871 RepID=UPI001BDA9348|nr:GGDEF domain-containing protein [Williamsia sp. CHRR-6]MBT0567288.1 GGDEF domain-containing protein [Williamsia sp. CHRR-6]